MDWKRSVVAALLVLGGVLGGWLATGATAQDAARARARWQVSSWSLPGANSRHGAFVVDMESGDLYVVMGRTAEGQDTDRLCKTEYPQGLVYVGRPKR